MTYYNDFDDHCVRWLNNLSDAGLIGSGKVDGMPIQEVKAVDVKDYIRCHFFAGIGGWDYALQLAGWPEDVPVWTGSCPCQPFSNAGKRKGNLDERHLWPEFFRLIRECRPEFCFGEQVSSAIGQGWLDGISADLEKEGYEVGACVLGAHSVNAPHIRQRLYWAAYSEKYGHTQSNWENELRPRHGNEIGGLSDSAISGLERSAGKSLQERSDGFAWSNFDVIKCYDGKSRRVESSLQPLVNGIPFLLADGSTKEGVSRAEVLKGIGNSIVPQVAAEFISSFMEVVGL